MLPSVDNVCGRGETRETRGQYWYVGTAASGGPLSGFPFFGTPDSPETIRCACERRIVAPPRKKCLPPTFQDRRIHVEFASSCLDRLFDYLADDAISKLWRAKGRYVKASPYSTNSEPVSGYQKSTAQTSFLSYFVSTTPDSEHKRARLKTILFLQASTLLNLGDILSQFKRHSGVFPLEIALIEGKVPDTHIPFVRRTQQRISQLSQHHSALTVLVNDLHDEPAAEAYCTLGGQIVSPVLAKTIGESCDLREWASVLEPQTTGRGRGKSLPTTVTGMRATPTKVDEGLKTELITTLLKVYMEGRCVPQLTLERTILNSSSCPKQGAIHR